MTRTYPITSKELLSLQLTVELLTVQVISEADREPLVAVGDEWVATGKIPKLMP